MNRLAFLLSTILLWTLALTEIGRAQPSFPDSPEVRARKAIDQADYAQAIAILSDALAFRPTADTFLDLGKAYRHTLEWQKAEDTLIEAERRFPRDPRIPTELASTYVDDRKTDDARNALTRALEIDPTNAAATELIASIELSEGAIRTALRLWNRSGRPVVNQVLNNSNVAFSQWTVHQASAFRHGEMMTYPQWRTTELRLRETGIFSNAGIDVEPAPASNLYNPIILTSKKTNDPVNLAFGVLKGVPFETSYFDWWDAANSGIVVNSSYRWNANRKRGELQFHVPIALPGILFLNAGGVWRSERWDITHTLRTDAGSDDQFQFESTGVRLEFKYIPHFKFDFGGGLEYTKRNSSSALPQLPNAQDSAKVLFQGSLRLADGRYQNRIHVEGYVARKRLFSDLNYSVATIEMNNRLLLSSPTKTVLKWTLKGGGSRGQLPVDEYFTLGVDSHAGNLLRAHPAATRGQYGNSPMGTHFALSNIDIERRLAVLPLFNTLNMPFLDLKALAFIDGGKTFDRTDVFLERGVNVDAGAGLKFETPDYSLNLIYGRSLRNSSGDRNVFSAYVEKRW